MNLHHSPGMSPKHDDTRCLSSRSERIENMLKDQRRTKNTSIFHVVKEKRLRSLFSKHLTSKPTLKRGCHLWQQEIPKRALYCTATVNTLTLFWDTMHASKGMCSFRKKNTTPKQTYTAQCHCNLKTSAVKDCNEEHSHNRTLFFKTLLLREESCEQNCSSTILPYIYNSCDLKEKEKWILMRLVSQINK